MITLLLDADIVAYKVACRCQEDFDWGDTGTSRVSDEAKAVKDTDELITSYCRTLKATSVIICLTDPKVNFRKQLDPTYKSKRKDVEKPELLGYVKDYMTYEYRSFIRPRLEADDVMGILATTDKFVQGDRIIVSEDKDMRTIPAKVYNPNHPDLGVLDIDLLDADRFLMWQTICGDQTDGYPGCKGVGPASEWAKDIVVADREDLWDIVLDAFASKGQTEDQAIRQAQLAHILRASSYNFKTKKIRLWQPTWLL